MKTSVRRLAARQQRLRWWLLCLAVLAFGLAVAAPVEYASADGYGHGDPVRRNPGNAARLYRQYGDENLPSCDDDTVPPGSRCYTDHEHVAYDYRYSFYYDGTGQALEQPDYENQCRDEGMLSCWERLEELYGVVVRRECLWVAGTINDTRCAQPSNTTHLWSLWDRVNLSGVILTTSTKQAPPQPVVSISNVSVEEGERASLTVTWVGDFGSGNEGTFQFSTSDGTAQNGSDFEGAPGTHTLSDGLSSVTIHIQTIDDDTVEANETFTVSLSNASGVDIGTGTATVTIVDNDPLAEVSIAGATVSEDGGDAVVTVTASGGSGTVDYETFDGTAVSPGDYTTTSGTLSFSAEQLSHAVSVPIIDDTDDEGTEAFTVSLSNASGASIGTATATVNILDDDDPDPVCPAGTTGTPPDCVPDTCPAGTTGTPPDCVPDPVCPAGTTGTPPNCEPIEVPTGCSVADTRLSALTVTSGGSNVLSGFSPTVYAYSMTADSFSAHIVATAANSAATVRIAPHGPAVGSSTYTLYMSEGSSYDKEVTVSHSGESCTYTVTVSRPGAPATDCPAWSGQIPVGGVCVEACPEPLLPIYNSQGGIDGCQDTGDCPYDLYGYDPADLQYRLVKPWDALWLDGATETAAVAAGGTASLTRTAVKCLTYWRIYPDPQEHQCIWNETNIGGSDGDCLAFSLEVEAVVPAVDAWEYRARSCGRNRSAPIAATWTADDATCSSTGNSWQQRPGSYCGTGCSTPAADAGEWEVTLGALTAAGNAYVDVPLEVSVTDWGDASHLRISVRATPMTPDWIGGDVPQWWPLWTGGVVTIVTVPRRSGPPPSDDGFEVNIADLADNGSRWTSWVNGDYVGPSSLDLRYVQILPSELLANDACPVGVDCTDPQQWPVEIVGAAARYCQPEGTGYSPNRARAMLSTDQGVVGCDDLSEYRATPDPADPPSVWYWPRMWASGTDSFRYRTYGGEATVTIRFTDLPPDAPDITVSDPGTTHTVAEWGSPTDHSWWDWPPGCGSYPCAEQRYAAVYTRTAGADLEVSHHAGRVSLAATRDGDPDGDIDHLEIIDANNPHLDGRSATTAIDSASVWTYSYWRTEDTTPSTVSNFYGCWLYGTCYTRPQLFERFVSSLLLRPTDPATLTTLTVRDACEATTDTTHATQITSSQAAWDSYPATVRTWSSAAATDPDCAPALTTTCEASTLAAWQMCYAVWPRSANPAPLVVDYLACDARREAAASDTSAFAEYLAPLVAPVNEHLVRHRAAGNSNRPGYPYTYTEAEWEAAIAAVDPHLHDRYCDDGTITVVLGDSSAVSLQPAAASATEGTPISFEVVLDTPSAIDVAVHLSVMPDTAGVDPAEPSDYDLSSDPGCRAVLLPVTIPAGQDRATVQVCTVADSIHENDETLLVEITAATGASLGTVTQAVGTITNDDPLPQLSIGDTSVAEDASIPLNPPVDITGDGIPDSEYVYGETAQFTVTLTGESDRTITVSYDTEATPGTATSTTSCQSYPGSAVEDYRPKSGTLTFIPGDTSETFTVTLCPDDQYEGDETIVATLSGPTNAALGTGTGTGTILDNETQPLSLLQQCELLHGPGWAPVLYPDGTPWTDSFGQIVCAMPH